MRRSQVKNKVKREICCPGRLAAGGKKLQAVAEQTVKERERMTRDCKILIKRHAGNGSAVPCAQRMGVDGGIAHVGTLQQSEVVDLLQILFGFGQNRATIFVIEERLEVIPGQSGVIELLSDDPVVVTTHQQRIGTAAPCGSVRKFHDSGL